MSQAVDPQQPSEIRDIHEHDLEPIENAVRLFRARVIEALPKEVAEKMERLVTAFASFARSEAHRQVLASYGAPKTPSGKA